jgi:hypothetical protein
MRVERAIDEFDTDEQLRDLVRLRTIELSSGQSSKATTEDEGPRLY